MLYLKSRKKIYYIFGTKDGRQLRVSTGQTIKKKAELVLKAYENDYDDKNFGTKKHVPTLLEAIEEYVDIKTYVKGGFLSPTAEKYLKGVSDKFGHIYIDELPFKFNQMIKEHCPDSWKDSSTNRLLANIQSAINLQKEKLNKSKISIKKFKEAEVKIEYHNKEEFEILVKHSEKLKPFVTFLYYTGCRRIEAFNLDWKDISYEKNEMAIYMQKVYKYKYLPIHPELKKALGEKKTGSVFGFKDYSSIKRTWKRMVKNSGIYSSPHMFRHSFATNLIANTDIKTVMNLGGWATEKSLVRYLKVVDKRKNQAIESL